MKESELSSNFGREIIYNKTEKGTLLGITVRQGDKKILAVVRHQNGDTLYFDLEDIELVK
jgi:hypothetical protein